MVSELEVPVQYHLPIGNELIYLNDLIGERIEVKFLISKAFLAELKDSI